MKGSSKRTPSERVSLLFASGFGIGFIPPMPGTLGSIEGIVLAYFTKDLSLGLKLIILFIITLLGILTADVVSKALQDGDPDEVVIDEIAGSYISVFVAKSLFDFALAFILFRIIDISKPPPLRRLERLKGGLGIMMDDLVAGVLTALIVFLIIIFKSSLW